MGIVVGLLVVLTSVASLVFSFIQLEGEAWTLVKWANIMALSIGFVYVIVKQQMLVYLSRRLVEAAFTLFVIATMTFTILRFIPGGPFDSDKALPPEVKANIEAK